MPDLQALFDSILADRGNDDLRLSYADAIADSEPDHAELIRLQVEWARVSDPSLAPRDLRDRSRRLEMSVRPRLQAMVMPPAKAASLGRGFIQSVLIDATEFLTHAEALLSRAPILDLKLLDAKAVIGQVCASPHLHGLRSLVLSGGIGDDGARAVASSPHLGTLRWLDLSHNGITEEGLEALAASTNLPRLAHLVFNGNVAADPTPQIAEEMGMIHHVNYPDAGRRLQAKYGHRAWLGDAPRGISRVEHF
ncbi:MAG: TIGR02996 domain-containing protein [Myxococcota bacterium]